MDSQRVQRARNDLRKLLRVADKHEFCRMIWSVDALQSGRAHEVDEFLGYPPEVIITEATSPHFAHKWMLETLVNEALSSKRSDALRHLNCRHYGAFRRTFSALLSLENAEDGFYLKTHGILDEIPRIAHRQFEWHEGWHTPWNLYRSTYLYCGPSATDYFVEKHGLTPANFVLSGYAAFVAALMGPGLLSPLVMPEIGLAADDFQRALPLLCLSLSGAQREAVRLRKHSPVRTCFRPSILRRYPCISVIDSHHIVVPIPGLVLARVTTGLYYDLVASGPGDVTREMAKRFEDYSRELMAAMLPDFDARPEAIYQVGRQQRATPDILLYEGDCCVLVVECKSTRMSIDVRFGEDPEADGARALSELSKAVLQVWRYFAHVRRGLIAAHQTKAEAVGLVLTLDPWLRMVRGRRDAIIARATGLADAEGNIEPADRRAVAFCSVDDLEALLSRSSSASFLATVAASADPANEGWNLTNLHKQRFAPNPPVVKPYPFKARLGEVLPWWDQIEDL